MVMDRGRKRSVAYVSNRQERSGGVRTWEELADTGERQTVARSHKCTRRREGKVGRKRHIYWTSAAGGVVRCGSTKRIHQRGIIGGARGIRGELKHSTGNEERPA